MDIRNWPIDRIMQLPDHCFGRRWPIAFSSLIEISETLYFISELALPERTVIWQLFCWTPIFGGITVVPVDIDFIFKLGDQLPTAANLLAMEPLFNGFDHVVAGERSIYAFSGVLPIRQIVQSSGRRICLVVINNVASPFIFSAGLVVSSVPTEVPEWLISGPGRGR